MKKKDGKVGAIIVAAGTSTRMGEVDKVFANLAGEPLLAKVVTVFNDCQSIDEIVIVLAKRSLELGRKLAKEHNWHKVVGVCPGGTRRQVSVKEGLRRLNNRKCGNTH